jgi:hypothetical protein
LTTNGLDIYRRGGARQRKPNSRLRVSRRHILMQR